MTQREIKFRVWDHFDNKMVDMEDVDASLYFPSFQGTFVIGRYTNTGDWIDDLPIMFYTGLKDKNGKDIYEGDILQYKHEYKCRAWNQPGENRSLATTQPDVTIGKNKVWFDNGCFRLGYVAYLHELPNVFKHGENHAYEWTDTYTDFEVIGNIYENPELL